MKKKLITLARELDFTTETEYFDYLIDSHINGNFSQCKRLFTDMKKEDQKRAIKYLLEYGSEKIYLFYLELL